MTTQRHRIRVTAHHQIPHTEQIALEACILALTVVVALLAIAA